MSRHLYGVQVPMRDGARLTADLHLPVDEAPVAVVLIRTPYGRQGPGCIASARYLTTRGYAVLCQDVRGRFDSDGVWPSYSHRGEGPDGYDTIEWVAAQPWCDGRVGTVGSSYSGWVQWAAARERPPHLRTMIVAAAPGLWVEEAPYCRGAFVAAGIEWFAQVAGRVNQSVELVDWERVLTHAPVEEMDGVLGRSLPQWRDWLDRPTFDEHWREETIRDDELAAVEIPILHVTGWFDEHKESTLNYHDRLVRASVSPVRRELLVGPWSHEGCRWPHREHDGVDFGASAAPDMDEICADWFDRHLKRASDESGQALRLFITGASEWRKWDAWPQAVDLGLRLGSNTTARSAQGDGWLDADRAPSTVRDEMRSDPARPVLSAPDWNAVADGRWLTTNLDALVAREDVLVYTANPVGEPTRIIGHPRLVLHVSCDSPDADVVAHLADVAPDGHTRRLAGTVVRLSMRDSVEVPSTPLNPGEIVTVELDLGAIAHELRTGHAVRLVIAGSYFPFYDRNPHTGESSAAAGTGRVACTTVHYDEQRRSVLLLPVVG